MGNTFSPTRCSGRKNILQKMKEGYLVSQLRLSGAYDKPGLLTKALHVLFYLRLTTILLCSVAEMSALLLSL
jgi:hypothetical protein